MMDPHSQEAIGKTTTAANEFIQWVVDQTRDGCGALQLAAGIGLGLEKMADADEGSRQLRAILATLLKDYVLD